MKHKLISTGFLIVILLSSLNIVLGATFETEPTPPITSSANVIRDSVTFLQNNWAWMVAIMIIIILGVIIYMVFKKLEKERLERDEPGFELYNNVLKTCNLYKDKTKIKRKYSMLNVFFFGLPLIWREHSNKILDSDHNIIGWYRGHFESMDNSLNLLLYKTTSFIVFENKFVLKIPFLISYEEAKEENGKTKRIKREISLKEYVHWLPNGDLQLDNCVSVEKLGIYYYCPVFLTTLGKKLDYRKVIEGAIIDETFQIMNQRIVNAGARSMEKGIQMNPNVKASQVIPKKTKEEAGINSENNQ